MEESESCMVGFTFTIMGILIIWALRASRRAKDSYRDSTANKLNLNAKTGHLINSDHYFGERDGIKLRIREYTKVKWLNGRRFNSAYSMSTITIKIQTTLPDGLTLTHKTQKSIREKLLRSQSITTGNQRLDQIAHIKAKHPGQLRDFFHNPGYADALADVLTNFPLTTIKHSTLQISLKTTIGPHFDPVLLAATELTHILQGTRPYNPETSATKNTLTDHDILNEIFGRVLGPNHKLIPPTNQPQSLPTPNPQPNPSHPNTQPPDDNPW